MSTTDDKSAVLPPGHYHHMEPEQAYHAAKLGMWLFLSTEVLLFGGLFCAYAVFKWKYFQMFQDSSKELDWRLGSLNTAVLLASSFFMAMAVDAAQRGNKRQIISRLSVTLICGAVFLIIKAFEYRTKYVHGFFPPTNIYFGLYFTMTGLHGLHVLAGMLLLGWVSLMAGKNMFSRGYYTPVEISGLYWHLVDIIWIFLFPMLYLIH